MEYKPQTKETVRRKRPGNEVFAVRAPPLHSLSAWKWLSSEKRTITSVHVCVVVSQLVGGRVDYMMPRGCFPALITAS